MIDSFQLVMKSTLNDGMTVQKTRWAKATLRSIVAIGAGTVTGVQAHITAAPRTAPDYYNAIGFALGYGESNNNVSHIFLFRNETKYRIE